MGTFLFYVVYIQYICFAQLIIKVSLIFTLFLPTPFCITSGKEMTYFTFKIIIVSSSLSSYKTTNSELPSFFISLITASSINSKV